MKTTALQSKQFWIGIAVTLLFIFLEVTRIDYVHAINERIEGILYDFRLNATLSESETGSQENIVIVDIDEKSMREQGRYPWSRSKMATLVAELKDQGAIVIAFDIFFAEPEQNPVDKILFSSPQMSDLASEELNSIKSSVDADLVFAYELRKTESVLGFLFTDETIQRVGGTLKTSVSWPQEEHEQALVTDYSGTISNIEQLQTASIGLGFINSRADSDGFIRRAGLVMRNQNQLYPSIALEAARLYTMSDSIEVNLSKDPTSDLSFVESIKLIDRVIQTDEYGQILIPFKGPAFSYPYISATDVLNRRVKEGVLEGAVVFIGTSAVGLADLRSTSVGLQYPGVEVHANVFDAIMNPEKVPAEPSWSIAYLVAQMFILGVLLSLLMMRRSAITIAAIAGIAFVTIVYGNFYLWSELKLSVPLFLSCLLVLVLMTQFIFVGYVTESNTKKSIQNMFGQYVPPQHIEQLMANPDGAEAKSERREMTVLFADIRGFTTLSESLTAEELSTFLNEYLSEVTTIIFKHGGTIDKYVGDMVMAFWNAPIDEPKHAKKAIDTALEMLAALDQINQDFSAKKWPNIKLGIGLSSGEMNVGDMGSQYRKAYTVLGDKVNLGSRVESLTKFYGVELLVSEDTKEQASEYVYRIIDKVTVVGKSQPVAIYEPLALNSELDSTTSKCLSLHEQAFQSYYDRDWELAKLNFEKLRNSDSFSTTVYDIMLSRISTTSLADLPSDWMGEFVHINK